MPTNAETSIIFQGSAESQLGGITVAGVVRQGRGLPERPMRILGSYAAVYLLEGEGAYRDQTGLRAPLRPGDLWLLFPDVPHTYGPGPGRRWSEFYIVFTGRTFDLWRQAGLIDPAKPFFHLEPIDYWLRRLQSVVETTRKPGPELSLDQVCRLQQLLADVLAYQKEQDIPAEDLDWLARARQLLDNAQSAANPDWIGIAAQLEMSYEGFRKRFARLAGLAPGRYHATRLVGRSCEWIHRQRLSNRQIADRLQFCDEFHFSRRFKQIMGMSPTQFRRQMM